VFFFLFNFNKSVCNSVLNLNLSLYYWIFGFGLRGLIHESFEDLIESSIISVSPVLSKAIV